MTKLARWLTVLGLILNIVGTGVIFVWGAPQPDFSEGVMFALEDASPLVIQHKAEVEKLKREYKTNSRVGLGFLAVGFTVQVVAVFL